MADKTLVGGPPPSNVTEYPPGTVWFQVKLLDTKPSGAVKAVTGVASTDIFTSVAHGLVAGDKVRFSTVVGGAGITPGVTYFVIAANLAANTFQLSTTSGGASVNMTTDMTAGSVQKMVADTGAAAGKTIELSVWSQQGVGQVDWGDSTVALSIPWSSAPAADKQLGTTVLTHTYTGRGGTIYQTMFESGGVRTRFQFEAGEPAIIDDVTRDGVKRPPEDTQTDIFEERGKMAATIRKQMSTPFPRQGGMVN